jgi:uncharacterized protein (TIGR03067 family)
MNWILLILGFVALSSSSAQPASGITADDLENLQGTWIFVALEVEGAKVPDAMLAGSRLIIKGDAFTSISGGVTYEGTIKIDAAKSPKTLDLIFTGGPEKGKTAPGIYEIGGDALKICLSLGASGRPTEFVSKQGSGHALEMLKRQKQ